MNCEEVSELLPAYVLGALEPDEVEAVEAHLRAGPEHEQELVELRATVFALDRYNEEEAVAPAVSGPQQLRQLGGPTMAPGPAAVSALRSPWRASVAAALVLLVFGAGWVAGQLMGSDGELYAYAIQGADGAFMEVAGNTGSDSVTVTMAGFERLEDNSYQIWALRDGDWVSVGVCNVNAEGGWVGDFDFSIQSGEQIALTIEPRGGSESPTSEPILRTDY